MTRIRDWIRWEFGRRIEATPVIRLITVERFLKATVLVVGGIVLLVVSARTDLHRYAQDVQTQLNLTPGRHVWRRLYESIVARFGSESHRQQEAIAVGAMLYGGLEALEAVGLLLRRRWAEYLVLIATGAFLPLEIDELLRRPTVLKGGALLINIAIVAYLVWRKRLFLERPSRERADRTEPVPSDLA